MSQNLRDTARDIILGADPSGVSPRRHRENLTAIPLRNDDAAVQRAMQQLQNNLQTQMDDIRRQQSELHSANEMARRRLEAGQKTLSTRLADAEQARTELSAVSRQLTTFENRVSPLNQDVSTLKTVVDRQSNDLQSLNTEIRNRPQIDPAKLANTTQSLERSLRDIFNQSQHLKHLIDSEIAERVKTSQAHADVLSRLQDYVRQQDTSRTDMLNSLSRRNDTERERMGEEMKRLNERVQTAIQDLSKSVNEREQRLREELHKRYDPIHLEMKSQLESQQSYQLETQRRSDERLRAQAQTIDEMKRLIQADREKYRERFIKINEALVVLDKHLDAGNKNVDRIVNAEIEARKSHEKGLLTKVNDVESTLNDYVASLSKSVREMREGVANIKIPAIDTDALRREMESIAADRNKLSMEGLLKLEERISRISKGLARDRRELRYKLGNAIEKDVSRKLASQLEKLDSVMDEVDSAQGKIRHKLEEQIPDDLGELTAKVENLRSQLTSRMEQEEEERYLAIKELQEAYGKLATESSGMGSLEGGGTATAASLRRDAEECKVAIKKLAESVTTVKNVLDRKIQDEIRRREQDVEVLGARLDNLLIQGSIPPVPAPPR